MSLRTFSETSHAIISNGGASGTTAIVAASGTTRCSIYKMILTTAGAVSVTIQDTTAVALSQVFAFGANGGSITIDIPINNEPWFGPTVAGRGLQFNISAAVQVSADVWYLQGV